MSNHRAFEQEATYICQALPDNRHDQFPNEQMIHIIHMKKAFPNPVSIFIGMLRSVLDSVLVHFWSLRLTRSETDTLVKVSK